MLRQCKVYSTETSASIKSKTYSESASDVTIPAIQTPHALHGVQVPEQESRERTRSSNGVVESRSISRGDRIYHEPSSPSDTLVIRTEAIILDASWDWNPNEYSHRAFATQDTRWIKVERRASEPPATDTHQGSEVFDLDTLGGSQDKVIEGCTPSGLKALAVKSRKDTLFPQWFLRGSASLIPRLVIEQVQLQLSCTVIGPVTMNHHPSYLKSRKGQHSIPGWDIYL